MVYIKSYAAPPLCRKEILRYAGCKSEGDLPAGFLDAAIRETADKITYKVCYSVFDISVGEGVCDFGAFAAVSRDLCKNLKGCVKAAVFAATVGVGIDRLTAKYSEIAPSKAVIFSAIGTERAEALCDAFCADISAAEGLSARPRFSPGYGDLDLSVQKKIFSLLDCRKHIGLSLNDSMLMSPAKSVTAIVGLASGAGISAGKCELCENTGCEYRGEL